MIFFFFNFYYDFSEIPGAKFADYYLEKFSSEIFITINIAKKYTN